MLSNRNVLAKLTTAVSALMLSGGLLAGAPASAATDTSGPATTAATSTAPTTTATSTTTTTSPSTSQGTAGPDSAGPQTCEARAFTDQVDRSPQTIYGLGTVNCRDGYLPRFGMTVDLFRMTPGGTPVHITGSGMYDCANSPCTVSSGSYTAPSGNAQYCTRVGYNDLGSWTYEWSGGSQCAWR